MDVLDLITDWEKFKILAEDLAVQGFIPVYGVFCTELEEIVLSSIHTIRQSGKRSATILINSRGGEDRTYCAIVAAMQESGLKFTGIVQGYAESNAAYLLQRCTVRKAYLMATIMYHWGGYTLDNRQIAALISKEMWPVEDVVQFFTAELPLILKRSEMSHEAFLKIAADERAIGSKTALEMHLIDEVIEIGKKANHA